MLPATRAAFERNEPTLFDVELTLGHDAPLVETALAQGLAVGALPQLWLPETDYITHDAFFFRSDAAIEAWRSPGAPVFGSLFAMAQEQSILVGARGWDLDGWAGGFYPEDLPPGWRLTYYSNLLRAVLVPTEAWDAADLEVVRAWSEDCDEGFRFVLELPHELSAPQRLSTIQHLLVDFFKTIEPIRARTVGLLLRVLESTKPQKVWLEPLLKALGEHFPVCVDLPLRWRTPENLATLGSHHAALCWNCERDDSPAAGGRFLVALGRAGQPRAQRELFEKLAAWDGPHASVFFDTPRHAAEHARQARLLAEIMQI